MNLYLVDIGRPAPGQGVAAHRPAFGDDGAVRHGREHAHPPVLDRLHEARRGLPQVLLVPEPVRVLDVAARPRRQPPVHLRRLGGCRGMLLLARRVLVRAGHRSERGQEGLHLQPDRRRRVPARDVPHLLQDGIAAVHRHLQPPRVVRPGSTDGGLPASFPWCGRKVRADPTVPMARRRHGRPDSGIRPDPCGDDGHFGCLPALPDEPAARALPRLTSRDSDDRGRQPLSWRRPSRAPRTTSRRSSPTRRSRSSATCSSRSAQGHTSLRSS